MDRDSVEVLPRGVSPPGLGGVGFGSAWHFTQLGNGPHTIYGLCRPSERGIGMSMHLAVPVSSGNVQWDVRVHGSAVEPDAMSFTVFWQESPSLLLQLSCPRALRRQTALSSRLQCAARVLASPWRVMVDVSLLMVLFTT